jgi:hypothetical protein
MAEPKRTQQPKPERRGRSRPPKPGRLPVTEATYGLQGAASPFGDDVVFPLPVEQLDYQHLHPEDE